MKMRSLLFAVLILFAPFVFAQEKAPERNIRIGVLGAGAYNMHSGQFSTYDGMLLCGSFDDGSGLGWIGGNSVEFPVSSSLSVFGRAFFHKADGDFESFPENPPRVSLEDGSLVSLATEDILDVSLDYLQFEVLGSYYLTDKIYVALGPGVAFSTHASYSQTEEILQPMGINFQNGSRTRQIASAEFDDNPQTETNLRFSVHGLIGADFPVTDNIYISPEAGYIFPFTNVLSNDDWTVSSVHAGVALKFELGTPEKVIIKEPAPEPAPDIAPAPVASLQAKNLLKDGTMLEFGQITVIEESKNDVMPLLPYIFFEAGESGMPGRYKLISESGTEDFDETSLRDSIIGVYHNLLNIVGRRMQIHDNASLTLT